MKRWIVIALVLGATRSVRAEPAPMMMTGPFASVGDVCASVPCSPYPDYDSGITEHPTRVCGGNQLRRLHKPIAGFSDVMLYPLACQADWPDRTLTYRLALRRADGWWLSPPITSIGGNDKYCGGHVAVRWEERGDWLLVHIGTTNECKDCGGQGWRAAGLNLLVIARDRRGAQPLVWAPIVVGEHEKFSAMSSEEAPKNCNRQSHVALNATFTDDGELDITGVATWRKPNSRRGYGLKDFDDKREATPIGHYSFHSPTP